MSLDYSSHSEEEIKLPEIPPEIKNTILAKENTQKMKEEEIKKAYDDGKIAIQCIDGRSIQKEGKISVHVPGGERGLYLALASTLKQDGKDNEEIIKILKKIIGEDRKVRSHTDTHHHEEGKCGCGHINCVRDMKNTEYTMNNENEIVDYFNTLIATEGDLLEVLEGDHKEQAILINDTMTSINNNTISVAGENDEPKKTQAFVYDQKLIGILIDHIVSKNPDIDECKQNRKQTLTEHTMATADKLKSAKDLIVSDNVYTITTKDLE